jgi:hypothetical protein
MSCLSLPNITYGCKLAAAAITPPKKIQMAARKLQAHVFCRNAESTFTEATERIQRRCKHKSKNKKPTPHADTNHAGNHVPANRVKSSLPGNREPSMYHCIYMLLGTWIWLLGGTTVSSTLIRCPLMIGHSLYLGKHKQKYNSNKQ